MEELCKKLDETMDKMIDAQAEETDLEDILKIIKEAIRVWYPFFSTICFYSINMWAMRKRYQNKKKFTQIFLIVSSLKSKILEDDGHATVRKRTYKKRLSTLAGISYR